MNPTDEVDLFLDGLVGPTHTFGGLAPGNLASASNAHRPSNPRAAAKQALQKSHLVSQIGAATGGACQWIMPPHERPHLPTLRRLGYGGSDAQVLAKVAQENPTLLHQVSSSSAMWAANAATVTPEMDAQDGHLHLTPANLCTHIHRAVETPTTASVLQRMFAPFPHVTHHPALPSHPDFGDEGAANQVRFNHGKHSVRLLVHGTATENTQGPQKAPARQSKTALQSLMRQHNPRTPWITAQQHPRAIDGGVFHNDVISMGHHNTFITHEQAFTNTEEVIQNLTQHMPSLKAHRISKEDLSLSDAVHTYLFNSQLIHLGDHQLAAIAPQQCAEHPQAVAVWERLLADQAIAEVHYLDLRESMCNGGGPACLRLLVPVLRSSLQHTHTPWALNDGLYDTLTRWIDTHYRDRLEPQDLRDPQLLQDSQQALDRLTQILQLGSIYTFQGSTSDPSP